LAGNSNHDSPVNAEDCAASAESLTHRERDVLGLIAEGRGNREIAEALTLSPNSVKWYVHQIFAKLDVDSRPAAIQRARELGLLAAATAARTVAPAVAPTHNLPAPLTPFVGRQADLHRVCEFLADPAYRLLTLIGAGGIGKTRLALQAAGQLRASYPQGAWLVELASLADPGLVEQTVAAALAVPHDRERPARVALQDYLREKQLLLVLDNCEHLVEACARLATALLHACPRLRILATSREALGTEAERTYLVPSLSFPPAGQKVPAEDLPQFEAVDLFTRRARLAQPDFELSVENGAAVAQICRQLDGIPLALELAAARLKVMDLEAVAAQLEDRFRLLPGGDRAAPPRLQTMRASIDWSYQLLPALEKSLLRRLSAFAGGCDLEAACVVCADAALPEAGIVDLLEGLVNKSLVELVRRKGQAIRYRVLETIRQYAFGKLSDLGEATTVRTRHLAYFASLSGRAEQALMGPDQVAWFERLEAELDNVRGALEWSLQSGGDGAAAGLSLASNLWRFWFSRARSAEGAQWLKRTLKSSEAFADPAVRALALARGAWLVFEDSAWAEEALTIGRSLGASGRESMAVARLTQGAVAYYAADFDRSRALHGESLKLYREIGHRWGTCETLTWLGMALHQQAKYEEATPPLEESLELARRAGDTNEIAFAVWWRANVAMASKEYDRARNCFGEALTLFRSIKDDQAVAWVLEDNGALALLTRDTDEAASCCRQVLMRSWDLGNQRLITEGLEAFADVAVAQGQPEQAARLMGAAEALREASQSPIHNYQRSRYAASLALLRAQLEPDVLATRWSEGRAMSARQAVDCALGKEEPAGQ